MMASAVRWPEMTSTVIESQIKTAHYLYQVDVIVHADCCDGSDESTATCANTCLEKSAHERQAIRDKVAAYERSLEKKRQSEEHAKSLQSQWQQRSGTIQQEVADHEVEVKRVEGACMPVHATCTCSVGLQHPHAMPRTRFL